MEVSPIRNAVSQGYIHVAIIEIDHVIVCIEEHGDAGMLCPEGGESRHQPLGRQ